MDGYRADCSGCDFSHFGSPIDSVGFTWALGALDDLAPATRGGLYA
jgi:hypothetical protein